MGAGGRMGRSIIASLLDTEEAVLSAAIEDPESSLVGSDSGEVAGVGKNGIAISSDLSKVLDSVDAVIDFTRPLASMQTLVTAKNSGKLLVLGTTGFVQHQIQKIEAASVQIPICFSSIRAGDIVGEHTAMFVNGGEAVEITHKAFSRRTFSDGAVKAALWLRGQKPGLYSMTDVLGLN